jgi:hypothetical protein
MKNIFKLFIIIPIIFINTASNCKQFGIITTNGLRIREAPSIKAKEIKQINKGLIVEIISDNNKFEEIDDYSSMWYKIKIDNITGWVYGGYLSHGKYCYIDNDVIAWISTYYKNKYRFYRFNYLSKKNNIDKSFEIKCVMPGEFVFSKSMQYVAFDDGTDVVGEILIYKISDGELLHSSSYCPRFHLKWDEETIKYKHVFYLGDCCLLWEEEIFVNGKIIKGTTKGKGKYHCSGLNRDPKCQ